jgi:integral membrane protein
MKKEELIKQLQRFRMIAIAEGISFLILLLIAMPLKYLFDIPQAVKIFGWVHGALFVAFFYFAFAVFTSFKKEFLWLGKAFLASVIPFGTFIFDKELKMEEEILIRSK